MVMAEKLAENLVQEAGARAVRIGGACGFWGDSVSATGQLLKVPDLDYLVYDYLSEITLSLMARARQKAPELGYATDFVEHALGPQLAIVAERGVKVLSNAGGMNPQACADALRKQIVRLGLDLNVGVVTGDDLIDRAETFADQSVREMFSGSAFPKPASVASINAYLGAGPVVAALNAGADIVITGRCADSALTLAACVHGLDWDFADCDLLAAGSLVGHLLECGTQVTGGNFTDWRDVPDVKRIGYPVAKVFADGRAELSKPEGSGGLVSFGSVAEQLTYEIGDASLYLLPDVTCDFSEVQIEEAGPDVVRVSGARGTPAPEQLKVSVTWADGWRIGLLLGYVGLEAADKAQALAELAVGRAESVLKRLGAPGYSEVSVEVVGAGSQSGQAVAEQGFEEVVLKLAARHADQRAAGLLLRELTGLGLSVGPGLTTFNGGRPKPSPVVRLFSFLLDREAVSPEVLVEEQLVEGVPEPRVAPVSASSSKPAVPSVESGDEDLVEVPLVKLAYARSGDKGDLANIGVIARRAEWLPWIAAGLSEERVAAVFAHFEPSKVERFFMPGIHALNLVLHDVLGGGGIASLRLDPQGKAYSQILLSTPVCVPEDVAAQIDPVEEAAL